jgi:cbb3-type cytochrome oxidase subunit 3
MITEIENPGFRQFFHLGVEAVIIISGLVCLIAGFCKGAFSKDERTQAERNRFYNKAAFIHLCVTVTAWAFIMPFALAYPLPRINFLAFPYDYGLTLLFFPIVSYCVYAFKKSEIYFNYSILESKHYYRGVMRNIGKFGGYLTLLMMVSLTGLSFIILAQIRKIKAEALLSHIVSVFLTYIVIFLVASLLYLLLSALEKASYDNETRLISKSTIISFLTAACLTLVMSVVTMFAAIWINDLLSSGNRWDNPHFTIGELITAINQALSLAQTFIFLMLILSITYFYYEYSRYKKKRLLSASIAAILWIKSLYKLLPTYFNLTQRIGVSIFENNDAGIRDIYIEKSIEEFHLHITYFLNFAEILALVLIIVALIKDGTLSKESFASLAVLAVLFGIMVFLSTQLGAYEFSQAKAIFGGVVYIYCAIIVAILGCKKINSND